MQNRIVRSVCGVIALLMIVPMMFACNNGGGAGASGTQSVVTPGQEAEEEKLVLPENHKFDGETFTILTAGNVAYNDFDFKEEEESVLGQAQYQRVLVILQENEVVINPIRIEDTNSYGAGSGFKKISDAVIAEDIIYHLGIIGGYDVAELAQGNYLYDLNRVPWVETSKSWWDQNAKNDLTINGMLFFTNGPLTAAYSESTYIIHFNKFIATQAAPDVNIYQLVHDMKWTIDKFGELTRMVSEDLDGNGRMDPSDRYGAYLWNPAIVGMINGTGTKIASINEDGKMELTLYNDNSVNMFNKYTDIAYYNEYALAYQRFSSTQMGGPVATCFRNNQALFWTTSNAGTKYLREMEDPFGILPYPLLSEEQTRYYSTIAPYNCQFICVPFIADNDVIEMVGVITESLAYYGKTITWPACYEDTLKGIIARDEETTKMLDIIYGNYIYDIGHYYQIGGYVTKITSLFNNDSKAFNSMYETNREAAEAKINTINQNYAKVFEEWEKMK